MYFEGSPVVTSDSKTSFAILSTEGYGHIVSAFCWLFGSINVVCQIKFPGSDLVWTVVPTEISRTDASLVTLGCSNLYVDLTLVDPVTT